MDSIKPRGELRRLRSIAAPHDLNNEALRLPEREHYKMHQQSLVPLEQLVSTVDGVFSWCLPDEAGCLLMYARYRALAAWSRVRKIKRDARALAGREQLRILGKSPDACPFPGRDASLAVRAELSVWDGSGSPGFLDAIHAGQVLIAIRRRDLARGKLVAA